MSLCRAVYKCQLCEHLEVYGQERGVPGNMVKGLVDKVIQQNQLFAGNPYLHKAHMYMTHRCKDGSVGLAHFAGFQIVRSAVKVKGF